MLETSAAAAVAPRSAQRPPAGDPAVVFDALAFLQTSTPPSRIAALIDAAGFRSARNKPLGPGDVQRVLGSLVDNGHAVRESNGLWSAPADQGWERFRSMVLDAAQRERWWNGWRQLQQPPGLGYSAPEKTVAALLRIVIYGGRTFDAFTHFKQSAAFNPAWEGALRKAVVAPFDAALFDQVEPRLAMELAGRVVPAHDIDGDAELGPLIDWLIAAVQQSPAAVPRALCLRAAQSLLFSARFDAMRAAVAAVPDPESQAYAAAADIAEGRYADGATRFEAAWKALAATAEQRKNLLANTLSWLYPMALLGQADPDKWIKARRFVASEARSRDANPFTFWGTWHSAIDQRLGEAPLDPAWSRLPRLETFEARTLRHLHELMLAAWLQVDPPEGAALEKLQRHAAALEERFRAAGHRWLALQTRLAKAALLRTEPAAEDASKPFFVSPGQERWREALAAIVALGGEAAAKARAADAPTRLIWTVRVDEHARLVAIEPREQRAGVRGAGRPRATALGQLLQRADLAAHDAALLRAVRREFGSPMIDAAVAAPALVRHPYVAWSDSPQQFIEVTEGLPALEVMTRGEHIAFRVLDPILGRPPADADGDRQTAHAGRHCLYADPRARQTLGPRASTLLIEDAPDRARLVRLTPAQWRIAELVSQGWQVPVSAKDELDAALRALAVHFQIASDAQAGVEVPASDVLHAELTPHGSGLALKIVAAPFGEFGPRLAPGSGRERVTTVHQGATLFTRRDLQTERARLTALASMVDVLDDGQHAWTIDDPEQALAVVEALAAQAPAIVTEWPKGKPLRVRALTAGAVKLSVATRGDWLELDGQVQFDDGEVLQLRALLEAMQSGGGRYVALRDGDFVALSDSLRQQLADLNAIALPHGHGQRVGSVAALAWSAAHGDAIALEGDAGWRERAAAWDSALARVFDVPGSLQAELRDYQMEGYRWLMRLAASGLGACLADDMGLGKTLMTLAVLLARAAGGPALVVAPTSVCSNWIAEAARFAPSLEVRLYGGSAQDEGVDEPGEAPDDGVQALSAQPNSGAGAEPAPAAADSARLAARRRQMRALGPGHVVVCSYGLLQLDADILVERRWHTAVLDEAQAIKNAATRRSKAAARIDADFRIALTGTPIENRLGELWSIMAFANPGLLGSAEQFGKRFAAPIERGGDAQAARRLRRLVAPFLLRRTKNAVLTDLPPRTEIVHEVVPGKRERALLEVLRRQAEESVARALEAGDSASEGRLQIHILAALTRLRRAACDPRLVAPELALVGAKVQEFERLALELVAGRHKALVFSQFTDFLALLRDRLDAAGLSYQYLDGSTPAAERAKRIAAFQAGRGDLFLISLKAGGFGLNLTVADYVIIADPWWNPAAEDQASGRAHRIGQARPVTVYRLVTKGSIEDRIVRLHASKRGLAEGILGGQDGATAVDSAQLLALLRGEIGDDAG